MRTVLQEMQKKSCDLGPFLPYMTVWMTYYCVCGGGGGVKGVGRGGTVFAEFQLITVDCENSTSGNAQKVL